MKSRASSALRRSLGPSSLDEDEDSETAVITPKRTNLSRIAAERNASKRSSLLAAQLPLRSADEDGDRPSYSADSLRELKASTPSTPKIFENRDVSGSLDSDSGSGSVDFASKLGNALARNQERPTSVIPSAAEIAEKKARRARLAQEQKADEYISLDPDDPNLDDDDNVMRDEDGRLVLKPKDKHGLSETRLVRDDEDIMENFEDFTEDGQISIGRKAEKEAARRRRQEIAAQIAEAEGGSASDSDASERERNEAFESAQTKHGTYAQNQDTRDARAGARPSTPPILTPIPTLDSVLDRLRKQLMDMQSSRMQKLKEMEALQREKIRLAEEEVRIQRALKETADKYEALRKEQGIPSTAQALIQAPPELSSTLRNHEMADQEDSKVNDLEDDDGERDVEESDSDSGGGTGLAGLGYGASRQAFGLGSGFMRAAHTDEDGSGYE